VPGEPVTVEVPRVPAAAGVPGAPEVPVAVPTGAVGLAVVVGEITLPVLSFTVVVAWPVALGTVVVFWPLTWSTVVLTGAVTAGGRGVLVEGATDPRGSEADPRGFERTPAWPAAPGTSPNRIPNATADATVATSARFRLRPSSAPLRFTRPLP